jgi:hypothetical protein
MDKPVYKAVILELEPFHCVALYGEVVLAATESAPVT